MARVTLDARRATASIAKLRKIAPTVDRELEKANAKSAQEFVNLVKITAPVASGDYRKSFNAKPASDVGDGNASAWGVFVSWIWHLVEFGTVKTPAQPHILPTFRLFKRRAVGRARRAVSKAVKAARK